MPVIIAEAPLLSKTASAATVIVLCSIEASFDTSPSMSVSPVPADDSMLLEFVPPINVSSPLLSIASFAVTEEASVTSPAFSSITIRSCVIVELLASVAPECTVVVPVPVINDGSFSSPSLSTTKSSSLVILPLILFRFACR